MFNGWCRSTEYQPPRIRVRLSDFGLQLCRQYLFLVKAGHIKDRLAGRGKKNVAIQICSSGMFSVQSISKSPTTLLSSTAIATGGQEIVNGVGPRCSVLLLFHFLTPKPSSNIQRLNIIVQSSQCPC